MPEEKKEKEISKSNSLSLFEETLEFQDGSKRDYLTIRNKKKRDFLKVDGKNFYNLEYDDKMYLEKSLYKDLLKILEDAKAKGYK